MRVNMEESQEDYNKREKAFWGSQPKSKHIEHFIDGHYLGMGGCSMINKEILINKREEYLNCKDYNEYHLRLLNKMIEGWAKPK